MGFQLIMMSAGALSACVDRPHTHGGIAAPDCAMHHQQPQPDPEGMPAHHQHHGTHHATNSAPASNEVQMRCACPSDLMSYLVGDAAALPDTVAATARSSVPAIVSFAHTPIDFTLAPTSPPPRSLSV
jgi:hypothetical protein